jgi:phage terminase small subunit
MLTLSAVVVEPIAIVIKARMPQLRNCRHENFARELIEAQRHGRSQAEAYQRAGYKARLGSAEANAARLLGNAKAGVAQRVQELMLNGAKRAEVTVASLLAELEQAREGAATDRQFAAATGAIMAKAKLSGLLVDRVEVGAPGSFDGCQTVEQVIATLLAEFESPAAALAELDAWREQIAAYASSRAIVVSPVEPARSPVLGAELERSLGLFRPARKTRR